jgi:Asp/Glu/hydantoin racemase
MITPARHPRIALIHAVTVAMEPVARAFSETWPEADLMNILEDSLSPDRARDGDLTSDMSARIGLLAEYALSAGADAVLFTCSAFGPAIEAAAARLSVPVLKPNEAMFAHALASGSRIGMIATFPPSVATMEAEFTEACRAAGRADAALRTVLAEGALEALKRGDADEHDRRVAGIAPELTGCDAVMLAHFSTSRARRAVEGRVSVPILTAPDAAVAALKARFVHAAP